MIETVTNVNVKLCHMASLQESNPSQICSGA